MKKNLFLFLIFLLVGLSITSCSKSDDDDFRPGPIPLPLIGAYVDSVQNKVGVVKIDGRIYYVEIANNLYYFDYPYGTGPYNEGYTRYLMDFPSVGDKIEFSGKIYGVNPELYQDNPSLVELTKTTNLYFLKSGIYNKEVAEQLNL